MTYQGAISQTQMNPGKFSLAAFNPFTVNVLMSPLLVHCAKTFYKRKYKNLVKLQKKPFYILMQLTQMTTMSQQQHPWQIAQVMKKIIGVREMVKEEYENLIEKLNNELVNLSPPPQPCIASHVN